MGIKVSKDRVLVKAKKMEKTSSGIILIPDADKHPQRGVILGVGENVKEYKEGNEVYFIKYAGYDIEHEGENLCIMGKDDILGIVW